MKGCRPLDEQEIIKVSEQFTGTYEVRNRALFILGVSVGGRISELLSLTIEDVWQNGSPVSDLLFERNVVKGKEVSRMIPCNADGRKAIRELIQWHIKTFGDQDIKRPLFKSREGDKAISRTQAHRVLKEAFEKAGLNGKLATHSLRKTYAQRMYDVTDDIYLVKEALGHKSVDTTQQYLGISYKKFQKASESIELNRMRETLHSIDDFSTSELIVELSARGIDMKSVIYQIKEKKKKAKIVKFKKAI